VPNVCLTRHLRAAQARNRVAIRYQHGSPEVRYDPEATRCKSGGAPGLPHLPLLITPVIAAAWWWRVRGRDPRACGSRVA